MWDTKILSEKGSQEKKCILKNAKYVLVNCMKIIGSKNLSKVSIYSECALLISFPLILWKLLAYFLKMNYTPLYTALCLWCLSSPKRTLTLVRKQAQRNTWGQWGFVLTYFNPIVIRKDRLRPSNKLVPLDFKMVHWALEERTLRIGTAKISWLCSTCWLWLMMMTYFRPLETWDNIYVKATKGH